MLPLELPAAVRGDDDGAEVVVRSCQVTPSRQCDRHALQVGVEGAAIQVLGRRAPKGRFAQLLLRADAELTGISRATSEPSWDPVSDQRPKLSSQGRRR